MENKEIIQMIEETKNNLEILRQALMSAAEDLDERGITLNDLLENMKEERFRKFNAEGHTNDEWVEFLRAADEENAALSE